MPYINFPHQINNLKKLRDMLKLAKNLLVSGEELSDDHYGYKMFRDGLIIARQFQGGNIPLEEQEIRLRQLDENRQSPIITAREVKRTFKLFGFLEEYGGTFHLTKRGETIANIEGSTLQESEKAIWIESLRNLKYYSPAESPNVRSDFRVRPLYLTLDLLNGAERDSLNLVFALTIERESEITSVRNIVNSIENGSTTFEAQIRQAGLSEANARDNVKILPPLAKQLGVIDMVRRGKYVLTPLGMTLFQEERQKKPIWYRDFPESSQNNQAIAGLILSLIRGDVQKVQMGTLFASLDLDLNLILARTMSMGVQIAEQDGFLTLQTPVSFDYYQDIPSEIRNAGILTALNHLIEEGTVEIPRPSPITRVAPVSRRPIRRQRRRSNGRVVTTRDNFTRNFSTDRQQGSNPETELRRREILKEKTIDHQNVVANIWELYQTSLTVKTDDSSYDLLVLTPRYAILHEIKTITPQNERKQIRHAVGQLLYYEHFNVPYELQSSHLEVKKILVLSCQPHDAEHLTFLASLGIGTIWFNENGQLDGEETVEFLQPFLS